MKTARSHLLLSLSTLLLVNACAKHSVEEKVTTEPQAQVQVQTTKKAEDTTVSKIPALLGTKWKYIDDDWEYELEFADNGVLKSTHPPFEEPVGKHRWLQKGTMVRFYFNDKTSFYQGEISGRNLISGTATSKNFDGSWKWKAIRITE